MLGVTYTGGFSIPYHLTPDEALDFIERNGSNPQLQAYMATCDPPYGIVIQEAYGQMLVWFDPSHACGDLAGLHVVDVTNMSIAQQVQNAPFESQDTSFIQNVINKVKEFIAGLPKVPPLPDLNLVVIAAIVIGAFLLVREYKRP